MSSTNDESGTPPLSDADRNELGAIWEEHRPRLSSMVKRRIDSASINAEVVLQDTFVLAARRWQRFKAEGKMQPFPWLYRLAWDTLIEAFRKNGRRGKTVQLCLPPDASSVQMVLEMMVPADQHAGPYTEARLKDCREAILRALEELDHIDRNIIWMRYFEELSFKDVAAILKIEPNTAVQRHRRALEKLRPLLAQYGTGSEMR